MTRLAGTKRDSRGNFIRAEPKDPLRQSAAPNSNINFNPLESSYFAPKPLQPSEHGVKTLSQGTQHHSYDIDGVRSKHTAIDTSECGIISRHPQGRLGNQMISGLAVASSYPLDPCQPICGDSFPCNNPECDDVLPCPSPLYGCDPAECVGDICYDKDCESPFRESQICFDQACDTETKCASPCWSQDCNLPACDSSCFDPFCGIGFTSSSHGQQISQSVCSAQDCQQYHVDCIDPRCLSIAHQTREYGLSHHRHHFQGPSFNPHQGFPLLQPGSYYHSRTFGDNSRVRPHPISSSITAAEHDTLRQHRQTPYTPSFGQSHRLTSGEFDHVDTPTDTESVPPELSTCSTTTPSTSTPRGFLSSPSSAESFTCLWMIHPSSNQACSRTFDTASELHQHIEQHHIDPLPREDPASNGFFCHWIGCPRYFNHSFAARPKLKRHAQTHTLFKPFICRICGVQMKTKDAMEKHARTHSGERPYACQEPECGKVFATSTELKTHMVVHSGRKPHECPICGEGFADSSNLSKHKKTHFVGMYKCPMEGCGARMKRWDQMRRHISSQKHGAKILEDMNLQREYKAKMEREWRQLPDEARVIKSEDGVG